eukprot:scaffold8250_cov105-Skeletonema_marinoi.AAC.5
MICRRGLEVVSMRVRWKKIHLPSRLPPSLHQATIKQQLMLAARCCCYSVESCGASQSTNRSA